jgi:hypothetical protein
MRFLIVGLLIGLGCGYGIFWMQSEDASSSRGDRRRQNKDADVVLKEYQSGEVERLNKLIAKLQDELAKLRAANPDEGPIRDVPKTEEGILLLEKEFNETGNLDALLALIEALLLQGEAGYPRLTSLLIRIGYMAMSNKIEESEALQRIVPAFRIAMRHERKLVGYIGYLITSDKVPDLMKTPALGAAMFLSMNGVKGSEEFGPKLLEIFMNQSEDGSANGIFAGEQGRMLIEAMGMLKQKDAVEPMLRMLNDPKQQKSSYRIVEALGRIGDPRAVGPLINRLKDGKGDSNWWRPEIRALARIGTDEAKAAAEEHIRSIENDNHFFNQAGAYLREQPTPEMMALVRDRFRKNPGAHNMWSTMRALQQVNTPEARLLLQEMASESTNEHVRAQAARGLKEMAEMQKGFEEGMEEAER